MGAAAAKDALEAAEIAAADIDLIINASGTVEQTLPDGGALVQRALGLGRSGIPSFSVNATCLSFLAALQFAGPAIAGGSYRRVLVVSSDVASAGIDWTDPESAGLFGDAAAAAVLVPAEEMASAILTSHFATFGRDAELAQIRGGGTRWHPNDDDAEPAHNLFQMRGPQLLKRVLGRSRGFLDALLEHAPEGAREAALIVPHQASLPGLKLLSALGFEEERTVTTLETCGNCVAASIPLTLHHAVTEGRLERGALALLLGTGAGISMGGALLRF